MIKVSKSSDNEVVSVRGTPAEMMLFYCVWESHLWPNWLQYEKLGDPKDAAARQHKGVIKAINSGHDLLLSNMSKMFQDALDFAVERCRMLEVEVVVD
jgi:hypothetical protein